jgi:hypothetical protein
VGLGGWIKDKAGDAGGAIKDTVDDAGEFLEDAVEDGKETLGSVVNSGAHGLGDLLDEVGLDGAGDYVDARGDDFADMMGADVAEMQLGETDDPKQLIHGEAGKIDEVVGHLKKFASAMNSAATGLSGIDTGGWTGGAAEGYKSIASSQPGKWRTAGSAMSDAASAFSAYASTVTWAQGKAKEAIARYEKGQKASEQAVKDYNAKVRTYNDGVNAGKTVEELPDKPGPFVDPGTADMDAAEQTLKDARTQRDEAADRARASISSATEGAPQEPEFTDRVAADVGDFYQVQQVWNAHMLGGALKATGEVVKFARTLNPTDPYNLRNPAAYVEGLSNTITGLIHTANHPTEVVSAIIGSGWTTDPAEALGKLIPTIVGTAASGGAGGAAAVTSRLGTRTVVHGAESAAERAALRHLDDLPSSGRVYDTFDDATHTTRFAPEQLPDPGLSKALDDIGWTREDAIEKIHTPVRDLSAADRAALNQLRDSYPTPDASTVMQKVLTPDQYDSYMLETSHKPDFRPDGIGGSMTRAGDTSHLGTPDALRDGLRLDYPNSPFGAGDGNSHVIRFTTPDPVEAPRHTDLGGPGAYDGWKEPFTGNGFTKAHDDVIPEWQPVDGRPVRMDPGAEMWETLDDGTQRLVGVLEDGQWVPVG